VGIAMGARGTDVAREAAELVLVDDNFASIVRGIRLGRRIFGNLQKSMQYIFAIHIPIGGMALIPMLMGWPAVMLPLHVALLELVIDPTCAIAFENEPEDASLMQKPPRNTSENLLGWMSIGLALGQGLVLTCFLAVSYLFAKYHALNQGQTRSMLFATLVVANTALFFAIRTRGRNGYELWRPVNLPAYALLLTAVGVVIAAIYWPLLHMPLQWAPLTGFALATSVGLGLASLPGVLLVQRVFSKEITPHKNKSACKVE
jgi:Ca2+-transporting ATPase